MIGVMARPARQFSTEYRTILNEYQVAQSGIFHRFITKHSVRQNTIIHAVEDMNMATTTEMYGCLNFGHLVMMAGDRVSAGTSGKTIRVQILGCGCELPMGVFRFAKSMSHPVFAVSLLNRGREKYELIVQKLNNHSTDKMASEFAEFLEKSMLIAPTQWFNFYKFFK